MDMRLVSQQAAKRSGGTTVSDPVPRGEKTRNGSSQGDPTAAVPRLQDLAALAVPPQKTWKALSLGVIPTDIPPLLIAGLKPPPGKSYAAAHARATHAERAIDCANELLSRHNNEPNGATAAGYVPQVGDARKNDAKGNGLTAAGYVRQVKTDYEAELKEARSDRDEAKNRMLAEATKDLQLMRDLVWAQERIVTPETVAVALASELRQVVDKWGTEAAKEWVARAVQVQHVDVVFGERIAAYLTEIMNAHGQVPGRLSERG